MKIFKIFLFFISIANAQTIVRDVITNDHQSVINAIGSLGQVDDQIGMSGPPIISLDLNNNGLLDYVTAMHTADYLYIYFDQNDFTQAIYYPHEGPNLIVTGAAHLGSSFTSGDFNGDGVDDLLVGAKSEGGDGEAYVIYGSTSIPITGTIDISIVSDVKLSFSGFSGNFDLFGDQVAAADLNHDGFDDIIIGADVAWYQNDGSGRGSVYIIFGDSTLPSDIQARTQADVIIEGNEPFDHIGKYLIVGNFNDDNFDDLVFTSAFRSGGTTWVLFGSDVLQSYYDIGINYPDITTFMGQPSGEEMAFAGVGDVNGDEIDDLILTLGNPSDLSNAGRTYINYGPIPLGLEYNVADYPNQTRIIAQYVDAKIGQAIAIYDINQDGYDDFLLGGPGYSRWPLAFGSRTTEGAAFLFFGRENLPLEIIPSDGAAIKFLGNNQNNYPDYNISFGRATSIIKMNNDKILLAIADVERSKIYLFEPNLSEIFNFIDVNAILPTVENGSVDWADYDNDGDLDLLINGSTPNGLISSIYQSNGGNEFIDISVGFEPLQNGVVRWVDYDNDADHDCVVTGSTLSTSYNTFLYRNDGNNVFVNLNLTIQGVSNSAIDWGDYDNDGDLDLILAGKIGFNSFQTFVYRNDGDDVFTDVGAQLVGIQNGGVSWGDYDNDQDLDIIISGEISSNPYKVSIIYRNDGGNIFTDIQANLRGVDYSSVDWGDYDNDGDLDAIISGYGRNPFREWTKLYRNEGVDTFLDVFYNEWLDIRESGPILFNVKKGSAQFADVNNDTWLDVIVTGEAGYFPYSYTNNTYVHLNNGSGQFHWIENLALVQLNNSHLKTGDYDGDGDIDIVLIGHNEAGNVTKIYRNNIISVPVAVEEDKDIGPSTFLLEQNYPNPFNPSTTIRYGLLEDSNISLVVYDIRGNQIQTLESANQSAGWYDVVWNGQTANGKTNSTGIYFARLVAGDYSKTIKMLYLK